MSTEQQKIYEYSLDIFDGSGVLGKRNRFTIKEYNVIGINQEYLVIDNYNFETIAREGREYNYYSVLESSSVSIHASDSCYGNAIMYRLYSTDPSVSPASIKKEIEKHIKKKIGFFMKKIDLSILSNPERG